jgi:hypothetical protein
MSLGREFLTDFDKRRRDHPLFLPSGFKKCLEVHVEKFKDQI